MSQTSRLNCDESGEANVIASNTAAFAGTAHALDFTIFHDGLSAWWEADAQAHLAARGFANHQIRNITANKGNRYGNKIVFSLHLAGTGTSQTG